MTLDGTFESFNLNSSVNDWLDEISGGTSIFGAGIINGNGVAGHGVTLPASNFGILGFEEKNLPLKPNTWYRVEFMIKGVPFRIAFSYPREAPNPDNPKDQRHQNEIMVDHNYGSHAPDFCFVCSACDHVQWGTQADGNWAIGGFRELPAKCPGCDAEGTLYRDGKRRSYHDWTLVYEDFKTSDFVGVSGVYYWSMIMIGWDCAVSVDNFMVYEITGEGGDAVGGDEVTDLTPEGRLLPPAMVGRAVPARRVDVPQSALEPQGGAEGTPRPTPVEFFFSAQRQTLPQETDRAMKEARQRIANEWGVPPPPVRLVVRDDLEANEMVVHVLGEPAWQGAIPATKDEAVAQAAALLPEIYKQHARGLLTLRDTRGLLDRVAERNSIAVAEAEKTLELSGIHATLCALLADSQSILQLPVIIDALAAESRETKDPEALARKAKEWLVVEKVD